MRVIIRRFFELLLINTILSSIIVGLYELELLPGEHVFVKFAMLLGAVLFAVIQAFMLRHCYFDLCNKYDYYLFNYLAYAVFMVVDIAVFFLCNNVIFTWGFGITKFLRFISVGMDTFFGIIVFHLAMLVIIALAPIGMGWVFILKKESDGEEQEQPNLLDAEDL